MFSEQNLSIIANICTIISSFSIVYALYFYIKEKIKKNRTLDFSNIDKRTKYLKLIAKEPSMLDKVVIKSKNLKNKDFTYILINRHTFAEKSIREKNLRNGLSFILSDTAIQTLGHAFPSAVRDMELILKRYCSLSLDGSDFYGYESKRVDAWVNLKNRGQFVIKFPIPKNLYQEETFNNVRFGKGYIPDFGEEVINSYFFPYLISYVSRTYFDLSENEVVTLVLPHSWEIGPS
jgi:hypothetical protein